MCSQHVGRAFDGFIGVGVARGGGAAETAFHKAGRLGKVVEFAGVLRLLEDMPERDVTVGFQTRAPELVLDMNRRERRGMNGIVLHLGLPKRQEQDHDHQTGSSSTGMHECNPSSPMAKVAEAWDRGHLTRKVHAIGRRCARDARGLRWHPGA